MSARKAQGLRLPVLAAALATAGAAAAQDVSLNYERLSSLEEPVAFEIGTTTLVLNGVLDSALVHDMENGEASGAGFTGNLQIAALAQLANRWRVGATWFGQYAASDAFGDDSGEDYTDNAALSVGGVWGTAVAGNVSGTVRERTRRLRGVGNAALGFDDFLGGLGDTGAGYVGRFGPWTVAAAADGDGNFDLGAMSQRPHGTSDYRLTLRANAGGLTAFDAREFDTMGASMGGELIHGSTTFDAGVGFERLMSTGADADRGYLSAGVRTKTGALSLSLEGHYGRVGDGEEISAALGARYDIARGLSANLGVNRARLRAAIGRSTIADADETSTELSMRYSF